MKTNMPACAIAVMVLAGCASSSGVVPIGKDTFMIARTEERLDGSSNNVKAKVLQEANEYCASRGKVVQVTSHSQKDTVIFKSDATAEVQFMCLDANDPQLKRPVLERSPDVVTRKDDSLAADINIHTNEGSNRDADLYTELMKLDDLRKKGVLTEEEFQAQKKLLLDKQK